MANNSFRSDRGRDPLAELARLIGQGDPSSGGSSREAYAAARPRATGAREADRAPEERYDPPAPRGDTRYAAQSAPDPYASPDYRQAQERYRDAGYQDRTYQDQGYSDQGRHGQANQDQADQDDAYQDDAYQDQAYQNQAYQNQAYQNQAYQNQAYQGQAYPDQAYPDQAYPDQAYPDQGFDEPAGSRFFSGPAGQFNGFREEPGQGLQHDYDDAPQQARDLPVFAFAPDDPRYQGDEQHYADEAGASDHAYREPRRSAPRSALVAGMAVLALVVTGSAGAFGYRTMFGGSVLPTLPPIIKASSGPNKIALDPQAGAAAANAQAVATTGSTEKLVSREEQPVTIEAPKAAPRVVATIPVLGNGQSSMPAGMGGLPATGAPNGPNRVASADPPWPASPVAPAAAAPAVAPAPPVQVSSEPKKIRTVTIHNDQTGAVPDSPTGAATVRAPSRTSSKSTGGAVPMSIVPGQGDAAPAPAPRVRTAVAAASPSAAPSSGGGSFVQLASRRSESDAQAEFRALQARFPDQLNGREPVIRRADLGEKGTFYRALVGPFASAEEAAQWCGGLKAAGGNCILHRN